MAMSVELRSKNFSGRFRAAVAALQDEMAVPQAKLATMISETLADTGFAKGRFEQGSSKAYASYLPGDRPADAIEQYRDSRAGKHWKWKGRLKPGRPIYRDGKPVIGRRGVDQARTPGAIAGLSSRGSVREYAPRPSLTLRRKPIYKFSRSRITLRAVSFDQATTALASTRSGWSDDASGLSAASPYHDVRVQKSGDLGYAIRLKIKSPLEGAVRIGRRARRRVVEDAIKANQREWNRVVAKGLNPAYAAANEVLKTGKKQRRRRAKI